MNIRICRGRALSEQGRKTFIYGVIRGGLNKNEHCRKNRCYMARRKADINIGYRAASEVIRLSKSTKHACEIMGCNRELLKGWRHGVAPSAIYLVRLHEIGADIIWILTGEKKNEN